MGVDRKTSTEPSTMKNAVEPYSPSRQIISPARKRRSTTACWFNSRNVPDTFLKNGIFWRFSTVTGWPGSTVLTTVLLVSAPVGQETMHSPQETQLELPIG